MKKDDKRIPVSRKLQDDPKATEIISIWMATDDPLPYAVGTRLRSSQRRMCHIPLAYALSALAKECKVSTESLILDILKNLTAIEGYNAVESLCKRKDLQRAMTFRRRGCD